MVIIKRRLLAAISKIMMISKLIWPIVELSDCRTLRFQDSQILKSVCVYSRERPHRTMTFFMSFGGFLINQTGPSPVGSFVLFSMFLLLHICECIQCSHRPFTASSRSFRNRSGFGETSRETSKETLLERPTPGTRHKQFESGKSKAAGKDAKQKNGR